MRLVYPLLCLLLALLCLTLPGIAQPLPEEEVVPLERLTLVLSGNSGGLASAYRYEIQQPYLLASSFLQQQGDGRDFRVSGNTIPFHDRGNYLWGPGFGIRQLRAFLAAVPEPLERRQVIVLQGADSLIADPSTGQGVMSRLEGWLRRQSGLRDRFRLREAELMLYPDGVRRLRLSEAAERFSSEPLDWELLIGFGLEFGKPTQTSDSESNRPESLMVIGQPEGEGSRRLSLLRQLREPGDLLLDAGNLLEGLSSIETNRLSRQRENSLRMAADLHYDAINVGPNELLGGLDQLEAEADQYDLPLVSASLRRAGAYLFAPYKIIKQGQFRIALIGIGDHEALEQLRHRKLLPADTEILAPAQALSEALKALRAQEQVELVAVLTHIGGEPLRQLSADHDVALVLADPDVPLQHLRESAEIDDIHRVPPFLVKCHPFAVSRVRLESRGEDLSIRSEQLPIPFSIPADGRWLPEILRVRHEAYLDALEPLLPDPGPLIRNDPDLQALFLQSRASREAARRLGGREPLAPDALLRLFPPYLTAELLAHLEMNSLMESFGAEAVALRLDPANELSMPGPLPRLLLYERIKSGDALERYYLNGDQLKKLVAIKLPGLVFGGVDPGGKLIWGREIGDRRSVYRVLIPTGVAELVPLRPLLAGLRRDSLLVSPFDAANPQPRRVYLRDAAIGLLERLSRRPDYETELRRLLRPQWLERNLLFSLQLDNLQLNLSGYNALNNQAYTEVRETRVTSPSSYSFGGRSRIGLGLDSKIFAWTTAAAAKYEALSVFDPAPGKDGYSENQDDLLFSSELQLRLFEFQLFKARLSLVPYLEGIYDTEFTPTLNAGSGKLNPLQSELRGVAGLLIPPNERLKTFKTGFALRRDFNVPDNLEAGFDFKLLYDQPLTPQLGWSNDLNLRYFFPSPKDNASSLGLIGQWVSSFNLSLTENLYLRLYADGYLFQGKLAGSQPGASVILGVGLGYDRIWKPWFEPLW